VSEFSVATMVAFAGLSLVAVALALLARAYSAAALGIGLVGLLALTAASTWSAQLEPAPPTPIKSIDCSNPQAPTVNGASVFAPCIVPPSKPIICPELGTTGGATGPALQGNNCPNPVATPIVSVDCSNPRAASINGATISVGCTVPVPEPIVKIDCSSPQKPTINGKLLSTAQCIVPVRDGDLSIEALQRRLDNHFGSFRMDQVELVRGLEGRWYLIQLKALSGRPLAFDDRRFRLPEAAVNAITSSARNFRLEVLDNLPRFAEDHRLFLRGRADDRPVKRPPVDKPDAMSFSVRRGNTNALDRDRTYGAATEETPGPSITNGQLPNLRANEVRKVIAGEIGATPIEILDNAPALGDPLTVELILYVRWRS
jgi:hypothetical protein